MEKFTFGLRGALAERLEQLSSGHRPGYLDYLLETHAPNTDPVEHSPPPEPPPVRDWAPKIGVDDITKSIEIDVGSQVIVVNLSDFYKPRDAAQLFGAPAEEAANGAASGLDLLASTANMCRSRGAPGGAKKQHASRFTCGLCQIRCGSHVALRLHYGSVHGQQLHACRLCGQSFIRRRDLEKHECDDDDDESASEQQQQPQQQRVPPLVLRPPKPRRLEDTSSDEDDPVPPRPPPRRLSVPVPPAKKQKRQDGKKEAYVCRVCQSKFRDPQSVLQHLKQFHREHAMKAWSKFQENLRTRQPEQTPAGRGRASRGRGVRPAPDTFAVRSVTGAPMKLKLSRSQQQQHQQQMRRLHAQDLDDEPEEYAVLPSEIPALRPGQRDPIYHQTQYRVYQPPDPPPPPPASPPPDAGPLPTFTSPGYVTCGVCGGTKYYTYTDQCRLYDSYACESCRKMVARQPVSQSVQCVLGLGQCHLPVLVPRNSADTRCRACWLKRCLLAFNMPQEKHDRLRDCLSPSIRETVPTFAVKPYKETGVCERDTLE